MLYTYLKEIGDLTESVKASGAFEYFHSTYRIKQMSDHMPLWVQLKVDFSAKYIQKTLEETLEKNK